MGRRSSLTAKQWEYVGKQLLPPHNRSARSLARELNTSEASIRRKFPSRRKDVKDVANQIIAAEDNFKQLPLASQIDALTLIDEIKTTRTHLMSAANYSAMNAHLLTRIANTELNKIDEADVANQGALLMTAMTYQSSATEASKIPLKLFEIASRPQTAIQINNTNQSDVKGFIVSPEQAEGMEEWATLVQAHKSQDE